MSRTNRSPGAMHDPCGAFIVDERGTILGFDADMETLTGWSAVSVVGSVRGASARWHAGGSVHPAIFEDEIPIPRRAKTFPLRIACRDGRGIEVEAQAERLPGPGHRARVRVLHVLARSSARSHDTTPDHRDPLTGVLSGASFEVQLEADVASAARTSAPLAVVLVDVDQLRRINDERGRDAGDRVLQRVADALRVSVGDEHRVGRIGDDDFGVLLPRAGRGEARQVAASIRSHVERMRFLKSSGRPVHATVSIGAASFPTDADNAGDLFARAVDALQEARILGRNRVWCYVRRPRVPLEVPVYFDGSEGLLVGYTRDLSPSGVFVQTSAPIDIGMRCALNFPLPGADGKVHVVGRVVRAVPPDTSAASTTPVRIPGMGVEFERFGGREDRAAIECFLHEHESTTLRPETGLQSI